MKAEQIKEYEYCKKYMADLIKLKASDPVKNQYHGCGSQSPRIEHELEKIHRELYSSVESSILEAIEKVENRIESI